MPDQYSVLNSEILKRIMKEYGSGREFLSNLWNRTPITTSDMVETSGGPIPIPQAPPLFHAPPQIIGSTLADYMDPILKVQPELRRNIKSVRFGPNLGTMDLLRSHGIKPDEYAGSNLYGTTEMQTGDISVNPYLSNLPLDLYQTLAHESTHASGYDEETLPYLAGDIYRYMVLKELQKSQPGVWDATDRASDRELMNKGTAATVAGGQIKKIK